MSKRTFSCSTCLFSSSFLVWYSVSKACSEEETHSISKWHTTCHEMGDRRCVYLRCFLSPPFAVPWFFPRSKVATGGSPPLTRVLCGSWYHWPRKNPRFLRMLHTTLCEEMKGILTRVHKENIQVQMHWIFLEWNWTSVFRDSTAFFCLPS